MKYLLTILFAGLSLTVVTATPPNFSFQEHEVFGKFDQKLLDYLANIRCVSDVVTQVVAGSEFESIWEETKTNIKRLITLEWERCSVDATYSEQVKCKLALVKLCVESVLSFGQRLVVAQKWDMVRKIKEKIVSKCLKKSENLFEFDEQFEQFDSSLPVEFECLADVLAKVSEIHGLEALWKQSQPQLEHHIGKWKQCGSFGNELLVLLCNVKEGLASFSIVNEYIRLASAQNSKFVPDFVNLYKQNCGGLNADMYSVEGVKECVRRLSKRIKCISGAIGDVVKDTSYQKDWEEYKKNLEKLRNHLKACKNESSISDAAKCIRNELKYANEILSKFLAGLKQTNIDIYDKVRENIKNKCYA